MNKAHISAVFSILIAALALLIPAGFNGYPLVYSDTGAYIASGFEGNVPLDRPISYGLFLRHSSLAASLWFTVLAQAILLSSILYYLCNLFLPLKNRNLIFLGLVFGLILSSGISYFTSLLLADVFTAISFLFLFILLFHTPKVHIGLVILLFAYWFSTSTHLTHAPAHLFLLGALALLKIFKKDVLSALSWKKWSLISLVVALNFLFLPALHTCYQGGFTNSRSGHLFLTSRNIENGTLKLFLDKNCSSQNYALCRFKDSLPATGADFLWLPESPLYKLGGWTENTEEYKHLNKIIFTTPEYLKIYLHHYLKTLLIQIQSHHVGEELISFNAQTPPGWEIDAHFREELTGFLSARQAQGYWAGKWNGLNQWYLFVWVVSILLILSMLIFGKPSGFLNPLLLSVLLVYLGNLLAVCIASSGSRYNSRMDWLMVFIAILCFLEWIKKRPMENPS